jgi:CBS domain-containing protein/mannitol/fructose-specific phosphotransferase system IIA component (Ntr-type)
MMRLATLLNPEFLVPDLTGCGKVEAIDQLLEKIIVHDPSIDTNEVMKKVLEREMIEDTSYGHSFAFPHARTDAVSKMYLAMGVSRTGVENCRDGTPLEVVCLLLTPSNISRLYLQTLSALANFARSAENISKLKEANTPYEMLDVIWQSGVMVNRKITVADLMRHNPVMISENQSLRQAANDLFRHRLSALPVIDESGKLIGQISDSDLLTAALPDYKALATTPDFDLPEEPFEELLKKADKIEISQIFQDDHEIVLPTDNIVPVSAVMIKNDLRRLYVVDEDNKPIGVLHRKDIVNMILRG